MALTRSFQHGAADCELRSRECEQVDAADDDVSSQVRGIHCIDAEQLGDHTQVLGLNQRHLSFARCASAKVIAGQAAPFASLDRINDNQRLATH